MLLRPRQYGEEKPTFEDLDPDGDCLWIWEEWNSSWTLTDPGWCKDDTWWLPFNALPDPNYQKFKVEYEKIKEQSKQCAEYMRQNKESEDFARDFLWD